ncbi:hypothetical protein [Brevibacillus sp. SYP-B805]|uniref:hypothetical protein n=1 Tax=Brevibacillus sp. SYP-B805 TaxID=1578199 RepID=UPI0019CFD58E|nr:hypothetical protein [Brevibacillus sp. SYP-B805]
MKKWLALLAFCLLITGCGDGKQAGKAKTQAKQQKERQLKKTAIHNMAANKRDIVLFLNRAEHLIEELHYAAASNPGGKKVIEDGMVFRELPKRFDSKKKILAYFSRFWSRPIAETMYDNLNIKLVKGKAYLAPDRTDTPVLISTRNTSVTSDATGITATVSDITLPSMAANRTVRYRLVRDKKTRQYEISKRIGAYGSEKYK